jgi:hypothetical protein
MNEAELIGITSSRRYLFTKFAQILILSEFEPGVIGKKKKIDEP